MEIIEFLFLLAYDSMAGGIILAIGVGVASAFLMNYLGFPKAEPFAAFTTTLLAYIGILLRILRKQRRDSKDRDHDRI